MYIITGPGMKAAQQQNPGTATRVHPLKDPVENWDKGVKPDMNLFPAKRYPIIKISCKNIITLGEWRHCLCNWNPTSHSFAGWQRRDKVPYQRTSSRDRKIHGR